MANTTGTTQIPEFFTTEFTANWEHLVQQKMAKLREFLSITTIKGKEKSFNQLGAVTMTEITERVTETTITDTPMAKRWIRPKQYEKADLLDEWDRELLGEVSLPQSDLIAAHAAAYGRALDQIGITAALGTAYTGETGVTGTVLPSGQKVAVDFVESGSAANSGLTIAKLRQAAFILNDNNVEESDPRIIAVTAKQMQDLLRTTEVTSADYNTVRALVSGQLDTFMGFKFRMVDKSFFAYDSSTGVRKIVAYAKSGIKLADSGRKVHVDIRPDRSHALQIRTVASIGATRMEEAKVVEIACDEIL
jgi:hypothetical protein